MSSGSYFILYRKHLKNTVSNDTIDALKHEYFLANKRDLFGASRTDDDLAKDIPLLMPSTYKYSDGPIEDLSTYEYYDADGYRYDKLLEFHFGSSFSCLKKQFNLDPYRFSSRSVLLSKSEIEKMLQAIEYILSRKYSREFEHILNNEYVEMFGNGYSVFDNRFKAYDQPIYIDKDGENYSVSFHDHQIDAEIAENDSDIEYNLNKSKACFLAFLNAECYSWENEELVLEYSAY